MGWGGHARSAAGPPPPAPAPSPPPPRPARCRAAGRPPACQGSRRPRGGARRRGAERGKPRGSRSPPECPAAPPPLARCASGGGRWRQRGGAGGSRSAPAAALSTFLAPPGPRCALPSGRAPGRCLGSCWHRAALRGTGNGTSTGNGARHQHWVPGTALGTGHGTGTGNRAQHQEPTWHWHRELGTGHSTRNRAWHWEPGTEHRHRELGMALGTARTRHRAWHRAWHRALGMARARRRPWHQHRCPPACPLRSPQPQHLPGQPQPRAPYLEPWPGHAGHCPGWGDAPVPAPGSLLFWACCCRVILSEFQFIFTSSASPSPPGAPLCLEATIPWGQAGGCPMATGEPPPPRSSGHSGTGLRPLPTGRGGVGGGQGDGTRGVRGAPRPGKGRAGAVAPSWAHAVPAAVKSGWERRDSCAGAAGRGPRRGGLGGGELAKLAVLCGKGGAHIHTPVP